MQTHIYISSKRNANNVQVIKTDLPKEWFYKDGRTDLLYTFVCEQFPENCWENIDCDYVKYLPNLVQVFITVQ